MKLRAVLLPGLLVMLLTLLQIRREPQHCTPHPIAAPALRARGALDPIFSTDPLILNWTVSLVIPLKSDLFEDASSHFRYFSTFRGDSGTISTCQGNPASTSARPQKDGLLKPPPASQLPGKENALITRHEIEPRCTRQSYGQTSRNTETKRRPYHLPLLVMPRRPPICSSHGTPA